MSQQPTGPNAPWQPENPPAPPAGPQRSWFARHKILTALGAVAVIGLAASALGGGGDSTPSTATGTAATSTARPGAGGKASPAGGDAASASPDAAYDKLPGIGTKVRDGKFEFVVTKVADGGTQIGGSDFGEKAQGAFTLVHVTVTNIGDEPQMMLDSNQKVTDTKGRQFAPSSSAGLYIKDNDIWVKEINPGNTLKGVIVYDMPKGSKPARLELHDSMMSGGVTVALR